MIWFACGKCGKVHGRPETAIGAMVFCPCGQGLTVPWESTAPEPAHTPAVSKTVVPRMEPLSFGASSAPLRSEDLPAPRPRRRGARSQHDPNFCFNHESRPKQKSCADCGLPFCDDCVVAFRGEELCGPCKNYEAKLLQTPPQTSTLALTSLFVALGAGPLIFCLQSLGASKGVSWLMVLALAPQLLAFVAGVFALYKSQRDPSVGGQATAVTGMATASFTAVITIVMTLYAVKLAT